MKRMNALFAAPFALIALFLLRMAVFIEENFPGLTVIWIWTVIFSAVGFLVAGVIATTNRYAQGLLPLIPLGVMAVLHFDGSSPVKPFFRFYASIDMGMTEEEVMMALDREFPSGCKWQCTPDGLPQGWRFRRLRQAPCAGLTNILRCVYWPIA